MDVSGTTSQPTTSVRQSECQFGHEQLVLCCAGSWLAGAAVRSAIAGPHTRGASYPTLPEHSQHGQLRTRCLAMNLREIRQRLASSLYMLRFWEKDHDMIRTNCCHRLCYVLRALTWKSPVARKMSLLELTGRRETMEEQDNSRARLRWRDIVITFETVDHLRQT